MLVLMSTMISTASLSVITNSSGGIIDDCIITRTGKQSFFVVSNAGRIKEDLEQMNVRYNTFVDYMTSLFCRTSTGNKI